MKKIFFLLLLICSVYKGFSQCPIELLAKDLSGNNGLQLKSFIAEPTGYKSWELLMTHPQIRNDIDVLKSTQNFVKSHPEFLAQNPGKFENIINNLASGEVRVRCKTCLNGNNKGIPTLDVIVENMDWALKKFKNSKVDIDKIFTEMATPGGGINVYKSDGGAFILNVLRSKSDNYLNSISKFEFKYLENASFEADISRTIDGIEHLSEYKSYTTSSWNSFSSSKQNIDQLSAYIKSGNSFEYIANVSKMQEVANPLEHIQKQFQKVFTSQTDNWFKPIEEGGTVLNKSQIEKIFNTSNIQIIKSKLSNLDDPFYNFIKVL